MNVIRDLPGELFLVVTLLIGIVEWVAIFVVYIYGGKLVQRLKATLAGRYVRSQRENAQLRKYIRELRKEIISGKTR